MNPELVLPAALVGVGLGLTVIGGLLRVSHRDESLADILGLPYGEQDVPVAAITERSKALFEGTAGIVNVANRAVSTFDAKGALSKLLERARLPIRAGEYAIFTFCGGLAAAALLLALTSQWFFAPVGMLVAGAEPLDAVRLQLILLWVLLGSVSLAALIATSIGYRGFFTPDHQLRESPSILE